MAIDPTKFRAYWKLDEASGTRADSSSHANDLITAVGASGAVAGKINNGLQVTGINGYMATAASVTLGLGAIDFTIWGWWNSYSAFVGQFDMLNKAGTDQYFLEAARSGSSSTITWQFSHALTPSGFAGVQSLQFAPDGAFHFVMVEHIVATKTFNIYIDDVTAPNQTSTYSGTMAVATSNVVKMGLPSFGQTPTFDEVAIYEAALSPADKSCVFNAGVGGTYPDFCNPNSCINFQARIARQANESDESCNAYGTVTNLGICNPIAAGYYIIEVNAADINGARPGDDIRLKITRIWNDPLNPSTNPCSLVEAAISYDVQ